MCKCGNASIADLNGMCEKCWDNAFAHPSWKSGKNYIYQVDENGNKKWEMWL